MSSLKPFKHSLCLGLLCLGMHGTAAGAAADDINQAEQLVLQGRAAEALPLLLPHELNQAGDSHYDYLLGTAWLESNDPARASLTLERSLHRNPNHAGARLEMGRAYFAMGDYSRSRAEFEALQKLAPPPAAREAIQAYLEEIERRQTAARTRINAYLESAFGRDGNINFATSKTTVFVPIFNSDLTLNSDSTARADNAGIFAAGAELSHSVTDRINVFFGADARYRNFVHHKDSNFGTAAARTGASFGPQSSQIRIMANAEKLRQNQQPARDSAGGALEWRWMPVASTAITPFIQYNRLRYRQESNTANDAAQTIGGFGWLESLGGNRTMLFLAAFGGKENALNQRADGDKRLLGTRLAWQTGLLPTLDGYVSAGAQRGHYDVRNLAFDRTRLDIQMEASAGLVWRAWGPLSVRPSLNLTRNRSNIEINDYRRTEYLLTVRYDIR